MNAPCPFCSLEPSRIANTNALAVRIDDGFPISPGHILIIPRRDIGSFFQATAEERMALLNLLDEAHAEASAALSPDGFLDQAADLTLEYPAELKLESTAELSRNLEGSVRSRLIDGGAERGARRHRTFNPPEAEAIGACGSD